MHVVGIIGCGRIAKNAHLPALTKMDDVRIKYACDCLIEKAQLLKEQYPSIENITSDYKQILDDKEVEAVFILTPNCEHDRLTIAALKAGKHVLCEKPIAVDYKKSVKMAKIAEQQHRILNIGVCNRYHKSVETLEQMNRDGVFGNIYHVYCSFRAFRAIPGLGGAFTTKEKSGGGVLIDWGVHFFDLILYVLGGAKIKNATCDTYSEMAKDMKTYKCTDMWAKETSDIENGTNDVEDLVSGYIRTDKASISFNGAWAQNINKDELFIDFMGDKCGARLTYGGQFELYKADDLSTVISDGDIPDMYGREDKAFLDSCESGVKDKNNIENILESAKLLDVLYESAKQKKEIRF